MNVHQLVNIWITEADSHIRKKECNNKIVISIRFEKGNALKEPEIKNNIKTPHIIKDINTCSPAYSFLKAIEKKNNAEIDKQQKINTELSPFTKIIDLEQFCWNSSDVHGLFKWLFNKKVRYVYNDWERSNESSHGCWYRSQHGDFHGYSSHIFKNYMCHIDNHNHKKKILCMPVAIESRKYRKSSYGTKWEEGMLQQHRIYKYNSYISIHVSTRCGKWHRVWIDIQPTQEKKKIIAIIELLYTISNALL